MVLIRMYQSENKLKMRTVKPDAMNNCKIYLSICRIIVRYYLRILVDERLQILHWIFERSVSIV